MYDCQSGIDVTTNKAHSVVKKSREKDLISPTFYPRLFCTKVLCKAFLYLHFRFELLLAKEYWRKCAYKMLVKLTQDQSFFSQHRFFFQLRKSIANDFRVRLTWFNADSWLNLQRNLNENLLIFLNHLKHNNFFKLC